MNDTSISNAAMVPVVNQNDEIVGYHDEVNQQSVPIGQEKSQFVVSAGESSFAKLTSTLKGIAGVAVCLNNPLLGLLLMAGCSTDKQEITKAAMSELSKAEPLCMPVLGCSVFFPSTSQCDKMIAKIEVSGFDGKHEGKDNKFSAWEKELNKAEKCVDSIIAAGLGSNKAISEKCTYQGVFPRPCKFHKEGYDYYTVNKVVSFTASGSPLLYSGPGMKIMPTIEGKKAYRDDNLYSCSERKVNVEVLDINIMGGRAVVEYKKTSELLNPQILEVAKTCGQRSSKSAIETTTNRAVFEKWESGWRYAGDL